MFSPEQQARQELYEQATSVRLQAWAALTPISAAQDLAEGVLVSDVQPPTWEEDPMFLTVAKPKRYANANAPVYLEETTRLAFANVSIERISGGTLHDHEPFELQWWTHCRIYTILRFPDFGFELVEEAYLSFDDDDRAALFFHDIWQPVLDGDGAALGFPTWQQPGWEDEFDCAITMGYCMIVDGRVINNTAKEMREHQFLIADRLHSVLQALGLRFCTANLGVLEYLAGFASAWQDDTSNPFKHVHKCTVLREHVVSAIDEMLVDVLPRVLVEELCDYLSTLDVEAATAKQRRKKGKGNKRHNAKKRRKKRS